MVPERRPRSDREQYATIATGVLLGIGHFLQGISHLFQQFSWVAPVMFLAALAWPVITWRHLRTDPSRSPLVRRVEKVSAYLGPLAGLVVLALSAHSLGLVSGFL